MMKLKNYEFVFDASSSVFFSCSVLNSMSSLHLSINYYVQNQMLCDFVLTLYKLLVKKIVLEKTFFQRGFEFLKDFFNKEQSFFSDRVTELVLYLICISLLWIFRENKTE